MNDEQDTIPALVRADNPTVLTAKEEAKQRHAISRTKRKAALKSFLKRSDARFQHALDALALQKDAQYQNQYTDGTYIGSPETKDLIRYLTYISWALEVAIVAVFILLIVLLITGS